MSMLKYQKGKLIMVSVILLALSVSLSSGADTLDKESIELGTLQIQSLPGKSVRCRVQRIDPRYFEEFDKDTIAESIQASSSPSGEDVRGSSSRQVLISTERLDASLAQMRRAINDGNRKASVFVVRLVDPVKMFSEVVRQLSGPTVIITDSFPQYTINSAEALSYDSTSSQPDYTIVGSISEFDKESSNDTVTLNLYLLDSTTHAPVMDVSNTIHFIRDEQNHVTRFIIPGDGGEILGKGGSFQAIRQLVQYSILQLFGKFYHIPYNRFLHRNTTDSDAVSISSKE
jgi:hypothetical protein